MPGAKKCTCTRLREARAERWIWKFNYKTLLSKDKKLKEDQHIKELEGLIRQYGPVVVKRTLMDITLLEKSGCESITVNTKEGKQVIYSKKDKGEQNGKKG